jgi:hypothetical protein
MNLSDYHLSSTSSSFLNNVTLVRKMSPFLIGSLQALQHEAITHHKTESPEIGKPFWSKLSKDAYKYARQIFKGD